MKGSKKKILLFVLTVSFGSIPMLFNSCNGVGASKFSAQGSESLLSTGSGPGSPGSAPIVAGGGANVQGQGAFSVPTADAIVSRLQNGLQGNVNSTVGNFAAALALVKANMPQVTDPTKATGFDQVQLLTYGACSDLTKGNTPLMQSKYNVNPSSKIAANQNALVAAGVQMLDQYTAGLASQSSASVQVTAALTNLVNQIAGSSSNTSTIAFMAVCIAANTAGSTLLGF